MVRLSDNLIRTQTTGSTTTNPLTLLNMPDDPGHDAPHAQERESTEDASGEPSPTEQLESETRLFESVASLQQEQSTQNVFPTETPGEESASGIESDSDRNEDNDADADEEEDDEEEEPKLKYTRLTKSLGAVYRNGDAVSSLLVAGDKMVLGTHNGNIHFLSLPSLHPLRTYHSHSASVTSISISPPPPAPIPLPNSGNERLSYVPHWQHIYIATSSIDGHVFIAPLAPTPQGALNAPLPPPSQKDLLLKSFGRPILSVALSPNYYNDRIFLSGGLAGSLILSQNDRPGSRLISNLANVTNTNPVSWLGSTLGGLTGGNAGKDVVLHGGEGQVSSITWSRETHRFVAWGTEQGIKIMRSQSFLSEELEILRNAGVNNVERTGSWKRISAIDRPESISEEMAAMNKPKIEWVDRRTLVENEEGQQLGWPVSKERIVIGWGPNVWVVNVTGVTSEEASSDRKWGYAEIVSILQTDGNISGISLFSPSRLLLLVHMAKELTEEEEVQPRLVGRPARTNSLSPELRLISLVTSEEEAADQLLMSRFETLSPSDYHISVLPASPVPPQAESEPASRTATPKLGSSSASIISSGTEFLGGTGGLWAAGLNATTLFSSAMSIRGSAAGSPRLGTPNTGSGTGIPPGAIRGNSIEEENNWSEVTGSKIYIASPYDLVFATERGNKDHLEWMLEREKYEDAWNLLDKHPEVIDGLTAKLEETPTEVGEDAADTSTITDDTETMDTKSTPVMASAEKEKQRIGELWIESLLKKSDWHTAGRVCGKVLGRSKRWEHWVWVFEAAGHIREITPYIPTLELKPRLPSLVYETVLARYLQDDLEEFKLLFLEKWRVNDRLFDVNAVLLAVERKLESEFPVSYDIESDFADDEMRKKWRILEECLAHGYSAISDHRNALRHFILLKDADHAIGLIRRFHLLQAVADDIPRFLLLRVSKKDLESASREMIIALTEECVSLLVEEATHGMITPATVINQLDRMKSGPSQLLTFLYLRSLWQSTTATWEPYADKLLSLLATYSRDDLFSFLKSTTTYTLSSAERICQTHKLYPELVYIYSQTGKTRQALHLLITELEDVQQAISFAKQQNDPETWEDLLEQSMNKPHFIIGLLEGVGTSISPVKLIRRIPEGLEVPGLKGAVEKIVREYAVTASISENVKSVCEAEVGVGQRVLRKGRRKGVRVDIKEEAMPGAFPSENDETPISNNGRCAGCGEQFTTRSNRSYEKLLAFACEHVFHLSCFKSWPDRPTTGAVIVDEEGGISNMRTEEVEYNIASHTSVGAKVARAALYREELNREMLGRWPEWDWGCRVCRASGKK